MATNAKDIIPAHATHPGSVLRSELAALDLTNADFARAIDMPLSELEELLNEKRHVTEEIAAKLENALGIPSRHWLSLQSRYHYVVKRRKEIDPAEITASIRKPSLNLRLNRAGI